MSELMIRIHNTETDEVIDRPMTKEEVKAYQDDVAQFEAEEAEKTAKVAAAVSAIAKLEQIGLTAEEIAALRG